MSILEQTIEKFISFLIVFAWYSCLSSPQVMMLRFPRLQLLLGKSRKPCRHLPFTSLLILI